MHPTNHDRWALRGALVILGLAVGGAALPAQEPVPPPRPVEAAPPKSASGSIIVPIGVSQTLRMASRKPISSVRLNVDNIVRVAPNAVDPTSVVLTGVSTGTVKLFLTDVDNKEEVFDVIVQLDVAYLKRILADAVPTANVDVKPVLNRTIILTGWVAKAEDVDVILRVATTVVGQGAQIVNAMTVGGVMQVQLDVTVASVNRTETRRRGFSYSINGNTLSGGSILGGLATLANQGGGGASGVAGAAIQAANPLLPTIGGASGANIVFGIVPARVQTLLQVLKDEQLAKLLAEPKLITLSGRPAHFLSGGQQAVLSSSGGLGGPGVSFRDVGTELDFLPIVLGNGRIYLEVTPVVRSVNQVRGINTAFGFVPGFDERSVRTALEMEPGQTLAIGGLIQTTTAATASRVPVLGELPFLGGFFNSISHTEEEEELVILVTPHLVDAQDCRQAPKRLPGRETRKPDDYELFLEYLLEAPRGQREVFEDGRYKAAYKNDASYNQFPCADPLPREERGSRRGRRSGLNGDCGNGASGMAPAGPLPQGFASGVDAGNPGAAGNAMTGSADGRSIPPTPVENLPNPTGRAGSGGRSSRSLPGPAIPVPEDGSPRN